MLVQGFILSTKEKTRHCGRALSSVIPRRIEVTFRDPETSSLKTSFQEKISVRTAVRQFSPLSSLEIEVRLHKK